MYDGRSTVGRSTGINFAKSIKDDARVIQEGEL